MTNSQLAIVAHRGASALAPENTLAAFTAALALGVATIETDIRATRDGELVLMHDAELTRLTGQAIRVADCTLAELCAMTFGRDKDGTAQTIATPVELLRLVAGRARILFDLKIDFVQLESLFTPIDEADAEGRVIMGVRSVAALQAIKATRPRIATLAFGRTLPEVWDLIAAGANIVRLWSTWLDDETLARARHLGKPIWLMCGGPAHGDVGETTLAELLDYRRCGLDAVLLNDPRLAITANAIELDSAAARAAPAPDREA